MEPDLDQDLEAYLSTMTQDREGASGQDKAEASESESAADLDEYLNELKDESEGGTSAEDEEGLVDLEDYIEKDAAGEVHVQGN